MAHSKLPRSISLRLTLLNTALFTVCGGALLLFVAWMADRFMLSHVDESVDAELEILSTEWRTDGPASLGVLIGERMHMPAPQHRRLYRLEDAQGRRLAGNLDAWPPTVSDPARRYDLAAGGTRLHLRFARLADGSRLLVAFDDSEVRQVREGLRRALLWGLLLSMLLAASSSVLLTGASRRQVRAIVDAAHRIMEGDLSHRIERGGGDDEFDALAATLNEMLDRVARGVAAVRSATDNIAHDLRTPLARHRARLEQALQVPPAPAQIDDWMRSSLAEVDGILATFNSLLRLATIESGVLRSGFARVALDTVAADACSLYEALAAERGVHLEARLAPDCVVEGDRDLLFQAIANLLDNAVKAAPPGSRVEVELRPAGARLHLGVADQGPGVPPALRDKAFERLYRLDATRATPGTGLGLSIVRAVARLHGGDCTLRDRADQAPGALAVLDLPAAH
ncbi:MAG: ATP-binding protein [Sinimarinibacterium sp.]|jgi:signal transduction histidine kinase